MSNKKCHKISFSALSSSSGCTVEINVDYPNNGVNDGQRDTQPDMIACRSFCRSLDADFFAWHTDDSPAVDYRHSCWCKTALPSDNKIDQYGVISGETACDGKHYQNSLNL